MAQYLRMDQKHALALARLVREGEIVEACIGDMPHRINVTFNVNNKAIQGFMMKFPNCFLLNGSHVTILWSLKELNFSCLLLMKFCFPDLIKAGKIKDTSKLSHIGDNPWLCSYNNGIPLIQCRNAAEKELLDAAVITIYGDNIYDNIENLTVRLDELKVHESVLSMIMFRHLSAREEKINRS